MLQVKMLWGAQIDDGNAVPGKPVAPAWVPVDCQLCVVSCRQQCIAPAADDAQVRSATNQYVLFT